MESIGKNVVLIGLSAIFMFIGLASSRTGPSTGTTVKINGDVYTCVDIYEQPSLKHPALKDPLTKKRIHNYLGEKVAEIQSKINSESSNKGIWKHESCPIGTVPILQHSSSVPLAFDSFSNHSLARENTVEFAGIVVDAKPGTSKEHYTGATANINIYNPEVPERFFSQYSAASIILESVGGPFNQIQAGWIVRPHLFGDHKTRLYIAWTIGDPSLICFNFQCKGFIQTSNQIPLGFVYPHISSVGGQQFDSQFVISQTGDAWELLTGDQLLPVGQWPGYLFTSLKESAQKIRFGGQIHADLTDSTTPPMGSGRFKNGKFDETCYMRDIYVQDRDRKFAHPNNAYVSTSSCYLAGSNESVNDPDWNYRFLFGGPGGEDGITCLS